MKKERNVLSVLKKDGVSKIYLEKEFENLSTTNIDKLSKKFGKGSWAVRVVYNKIFGGILIHQKPDEGNRLHYHPDTDECWVIIKGKWKFYIEGEGSKIVKKNDIVIAAVGVAEMVKGSWIKKGATVIDVGINRIEKDGKKN